MYHPCRLNFHHRLQTVHRQETFCVCMSFVGLNYFSDRSVNLQCRTLDVSLICIISKITFYGIALIIELTANQIIVR